jgi:hypothetical protein
MVRNEPGCLGTQSSRRVKSATHSIVYILANKEYDGWTPVGMAKVSSSHQREVSDGRLPNTVDISLVEV